MHVWSSVWKSFVFLGFLFVTDLTSTVLTLISAHDWSFKDSFTSFDQLSNFYTDALDLVLIAVLRIIVLCILGQITVRIGTPPHELQAEHRKRVIAQREELRETWRTARGSKFPTRSDIEDQKDSKREPLLSVQASNGSSDVTSSANGLAPAASWSAADDEIERTFEASLPEVPDLSALTESQKLQQSRRAKFLRHCMVSVIFSLATGMQVYSGVKMVGFKFSNEWIQGILMAISLVSINAQQSLIRYIAAYLCQEEGHLFAKLHPHRLYYDENTAGHWCDLCRTRIREAYRCRQCDFDCCLKCFAKKDKTRGENQLRGEKGTKDEQEVSSTRYMIRALKLAAPHWLMLLVAVLCLLITSGASIILPNFQGKILDDVIQADHDTFKSDIIFFIGISIGLGFFGGVRSLLFNIVGSHISFEIRNKLFNSIIVQDIVFFDGISTGELTSRLSSDTSAMTSPMNSILSSTLSNILLLVGGLIMCLITSWRLTILACTSIYPIIIITRAYAKWSSRINKQIYAALGDATSVANQAISNIRTVRSFGTENNEMKKYKAATDEGLEKSIKDAFANGGTYALTSYLDLATSVLLLWYGGRVAMGESSGSLTVGRLITFQLYWQMMNSAYTSLISVLNSFTRASGAAQRVLTLMDNLPDIDPTVGEKLERVKGDIEVKDVSFHYQMRPDNQVLKGVSLKIPAHTVTALVGRSGGGKSTLVQLLMRFYDATKGSISIDGHEYKDVNLNSLHSHFAVVTQNTELFAGSIVANLTYGMEDGSWTMEDVHEACRQANAHDFIMEFEEAYDTRVGERGVRVSGGQRQRLAIARAMLRKSSILLLDEATSALDAESESQVQAALDRLIARGNSTILLVAHRLSTVMNAHQICVLDGGIIRERGTHEQLLELDGIYAKLVQRQLMRKQNIIEDEMVSAATIAAEGASKEVKEQLAKIKEKKQKLDDFDSLFDEVKEKEELALERANSVSPANGETSETATTANPVVAAASTSAEATATRSTGTSKRKIQPRAGQ